MSKWEVLSPLYIFTKPSARTGCNTWSIFKRSLVDLNFEFSFSPTGCLTKAKEIWPTIYPLAGERIITFITFLRVLVLREMQSTRPRFEFMSPYPFSITIAITPLVPYIYIYIYKKPFNCSDLFKNENTDKLISYIYWYLFKCVQTNDWC